MTAPLAAQKPALAVKPTKAAIEGRFLDACKICHHGDFHLGQMLIIKDNVYIIDFQGEPRRSPARAPA